MVSEEKKGRFMMGKFGLFIYYVYLLWYILVMNINLKKINLDNSLEIESYVKWENDLDFYHLIAPMRSKDSKVEMVTVVLTVNFFKKNPDRLKNTYIVFDNKNPIGQITIHIDPDHLYRKEKGTCWIGLTIGAVLV